MRKIMIMLVSLVLLTSLAFSDNSGPKEFEPKYYDNAKVLRVKFTQGESFIRRSYDEGLEEAAINLPIFEKDSAGTTGGRLEIYLGRLNYLRLDHDSEVVFDKVPELRKTEMTIRLTKGGIYLDIENIDYERDIEIQTPDCGVFVLDKGLYRINVNEGGRTEIFVYDGVAEVAGENYSRNVRDNQKIVMYDGRVKERPYYFYNSDSDDFDQWNRERNGVVGYARYSSSRYLDDGYEEYEYELSRHGRWRYHETYGSYIWVPYNIGSTWRPYYHGRWVWNPYYGYVWTSYDTWGFFTHHYGRWHWDPIYRWCWVPGYRWSPAWVSWFWDDYHYGWCPLSWWNRPIVVYDGVWWRNHHYRHGIPRRARSTTIIRKNQLSSGGIHKVALRKGVIAKTGGKAFTFKGHAPKLKPNISKIGVINAKGNRVVFKKGGIVSKNRYQMIKYPIDGHQPVEGKGGVIYKYSGKTLAKAKLSKYSGNAVYASKRTVTSSKMKSYSSSGKPAQTSGTAVTADSGSEAKVSRSGYKYKPSKYRANSGSSKSRSGGSSSGYSSSGAKSKSSTTKIKSRSSRSSGSSRSSSGSSKGKIKKKKNEPSYSSYRYRSKSSYSSPSSSSKGYSSSSSSSSYKYKSRSSSSSKSPSRSRSSYRSSSSKSRSSSSYKSPSRSSSSSYRSSSRSSRSSSSRSSRSSSSSRSSRSSSRSSSSGSSSKSVKKK